MRTLRHTRALAVVHRCATLAMILLLCLPLLPAPRVAAASAGEPAFAVSAAQPQEIAPEATPTPEDLPTPTATAVPAEDPLAPPAAPTARLAVAVEPEEAWPGETITVTVSLAASAPLSAAVLSGTLPSGTSLLSLAGDAAPERAGERGLRWPPRAIPAGRTGEGVLSEGVLSEGVLSLRFHLLMTDQAPDLSVQPLRLLSPELERSPEAELVLRRRFPDVATRVSPEAGGALRSADGRVQVLFSGGSVSQTLRVQHHPLRADALPARQPGLALRFEISAFSDDAAATAVHRFQKAPELRVDLEGLLDLDALPTYLHPALSTLDEATGEWVELPTGRVGSVLTTTLEHLSTIGGGSAGTMDSGWVLAFNDAQVSGFNGGMSYAYPLQPLPGRGGLTPDLSLSYNSRRIDGILTETQSDWAGLGWSLDQMEITRRVKPESGWRENGHVWWVNEFTLLYQGTGYELVPGSDEPHGHYYTEDEQFLDIERRNSKGGGTGANTTGEYWTVRLRDGTTYRLGYRFDSEQVVGTDYYDGDADGEDDYAGRVAHRVAFRWRVDTITDTRGIAIRYQYDEEEEEEDCLYPRDTASYLREIAYNHDGTRYRSKVTFGRAARGSDGISDQGTLHHLFSQDEFLSAVYTQEYSGTTGLYDTVRQYALGYTAGHDGTRLLQRITEYGRSGGALPATQFEYRPYPNKGTQSGDDWDESSFDYDRLLKIRNGYGGAIGLGYETRDTGASLGYNYRVTQKVISDTASSTAYWLGYGYPTSEHDLCYDNNQDHQCDENEPGGTGPPHEGLFLGYERTVETRYAADNSVVSMIVYDYELGGDHPDWRIGRELVVSYRDAVWKVLHQVNTDWVADTLDRGASEVYFVHPTVAEEYWGEGGEYGVLRKKTFYTYNPDYQGGQQYGNLTAVEEFLTGSPDVPFRQTLTCYHPNTSAWIVDRPGETQVSAWDGDSWVIQEHSYLIYDDPAHIPADPPHRGNLVKEERNTLQGAGRWIVTRVLTYTSSAGYYQPLEEADGEGSVTRTTYDAAYRRPVAVTRDPGGLNLATSYAYDAVSGLVTKVSGPNGESSAVRYEYDQWGRLARVIRPGDSSAYPTVGYAYYDSETPLRINTTPRFTAGQGGTAERRFYNGLGQLIQETVTARDASQMIVRDYRYNAQGLLWEEYAPYTYAGYTASLLPLDTGRPKTATAYDALGRVATVTHPDGTSVRTAYKGLQVAMLDENRHQRIQASDPFGRVVQVKEYSGTYSTPNWTASVYATTSYGYDAGDRLTAVSDTAGHATTMSYDGLGRKLAMSDPDMGAWSYSYDDAGNLVGQTDPRGQGVLLHYDHANRLTSKDYCSDGNCVGPIYTYSYDAGSLGKGQRTGMTSASNSATWAYDARGRVSRETKTISGSGGGTFTSTWSYNSADQVQSATYPDGEVVSSGYDPYGRADTLSGTLAGQYTNYSYVSATDYNAFGQPTERLLGNGFSTRWGYWGLGGDWDSPPVLGRASYGRLWALRTNSPAAGPVLDLRYSYDAEGNVIRLQDAKYGAGGWPTAGFSFQDSFASKDTVHWTWSSYQTVPDGSNGWVKSVGTGASWESSFCRSSYSLTSGEGLEVRLKVSQDDTLAHVSLEADDSTYRRFGVIAENGKLWVQVIDGSGANVHPAVLLADLQVNTWYVVRLVVDDASGFYAEAYQLDTPAVRGSYHSWMPTGKSWRFRHYIYRGTAWLDDYREFSTGSVSWSPRDWMSASYDGLDRLTSVTPVSGWQGYSGSFGYNAVGNMTSSEGQSYSYGDAAHPHAVTAVGSNQYGYDAAGNMVTRHVSGVDYTLSYDAESRLVGVSGGATATFVYDGDGRRVKGTVGSLATLYVSGEYEVEGGVVHKYYTLGGERVALREGGVLSYLLSDALGSTSVALGVSGTPTETLRYEPYGQARTSVGTMPTTYRYTGQRLESVIKLYYYGARWYDASLERFIQPDSVVPEPGNPQSLNRYTYCLNNPLRYVDPDGRVPVVPIVLLLLKAIDYGWTAWDVGQSVGTLNDPRASNTDRLLAELNIALAVVTEAAEPDELSPVGLPADDVVRRGAIKAARDALATGDDTLVKRLPQWLQPIVRGLVTEARVLDKLGMPKNTRTLTGIVDGAAVDTIPDFVDDAGKVLGDIKDVKDLGWEKQIRAQYAAARAKGYTYRLYVRRDTNLLGEIQKYFSDNLIDIKYIDDILNP